MTVIRFPERPDPRPVTERVSEEVRALIGRNRINQTTVAEWLGIAQSAISARLRGETEWKVSEIDVLARRFGVHPAVLLGGYAENPGPDGGPGIPADASRRRTNRDATSATRRTGVVSDPWLAVA